MLPDKERPPALPAGVKITGEVNTGKRSTAGANATTCPVTCSTPATACPWRFPTGVAS